MPASDSTFVENLYSSSGILQGVTRQSADSFSAYFVIGNLLRNVQ